MKQNENSSLTAITQYQSTARRGSHIIQLLILIIHCATFSHGALAQSLVLNADFNDPTGTSVSDCVTGSADNGSAPTPWIAVDTPDYSTEYQISFSAIYRERSTLIPAFDIPPDGGCFMGFRSTEGMTQTSQVIADASAPVTYTFLYTEYTRPGIGNCTPNTEFRVNSTSSSTGTLIGSAPNVGAAGGPSVEGEWVQAVLPSFVPADYGIANGGTMDIYLGSASSCSITWAFVDGLIIGTEPMATKAVNPSSIAAGEVATYTITIDNTDASAADQTNTVEFVDNLPSSLEVALAPSATTTCGDGMVTAIAGSNSVSISGGDVQASVTCAISFNVTNSAGQLNNDCSSDPAAFTNSASNLSSTGIGSIDFSGVLPACLEVLEADTSLTLSKTDSVDPAIAGVAFEYVLTVTDVADGSDANDVVVSDILHDSLTFNGIVASDAGTTDSSNLPTVTCTWTTIPDGASRTCTINVTP